MITIEEGIAMQGEEFDFVFSDGDVIRAYIKKFDPLIGLSCWSFGLITDKGYGFIPKNAEEKAEESSCMVGYDLKNSPEDLNACLMLIEEIKLTGKMITVPYVSIGVFDGCPL